MYESLKQFLGAYFHQDWVEDAGDDNADTVIQHFALDASRADIEQVAQELSGLLENSTDIELSVFVVDSGCWYEPSADGLKTRAWLKRVHSELSSYLRGLA